MENEKAKQNIKGHAYTPCTYQPSKCCVRTQRRKRKSGKKRERKREKNEIFASFY